MGDFTHHEELMRQGKGSPSGSPSTAGESGGASPASTEMGAGTPSKAVGAVVGEGGATQVRLRWRCRLGCACMQHESCLVHAWGLMACAAGDSVALLPDAFEPTLCSLSLCRMGTTITVSC